MSDDFRNGLDILRSAGWTWGHIADELGITPRGLRYTRDGIKQPRKQTMKLLALAVAAASAEQQPPMPVTAAAARTSSKAIKGVDDLFENEEGSRND